MGPAMRTKTSRDCGAAVILYPSLSGAPRPPSLPSIRADDSSSRLGSSICQTVEKGIISLGIVYSLIHINDHVILTECLWNYMLQTTQSLISVTNI